MNINNLNKLEEQEANSLKENLITNNNVINNNINYKIINKNGYKTIVKHDTEVNISCNESNLSLTNDKIKFQLLSKEE